MQCREETFPCVGVGVGLEEGGGGARWSVHGHRLGITSSWGRKANTFVGSGPEDHLAPNFEAFYFPFQNLYLQGLF
jgi:hypothetical protein